MGTKNVVLRLIPSTGGQGNYKNIGSYVVLNSPDYL